MGRSDSFDQKARYMASNREAARRDASCLLRFTLGAVFGSCAVYWEDRLSDNYRAGEGALLLVAAAAIGACMVWWWRGKWRALGLGVLAIVGVVLVYLTGLVILVVYVSATGGHIS